MIILLRACRTSSGSITFGFVVEAVFSDIFEKIYIFIKLACFAYLRKFLFTRINKQIIFFKKRTFFDGGKKEVKF